MTWNNLATSVNMKLLESQNERDARVEDLWRHLDPKETGEIDLKGLQRGLKKLNHPLKNANHLLEDVMKAVDSNGDGKIQYEEFRTFVEETESQLYSLFRSIDKNNDGKLVKDELKAAFKVAGLTVPPAKLDDFFAGVDRDNSGAITFDEWRDFLLFLPNDTPGLKAILSYYSSTVALNAEGDTQLRDEYIDSLGYFAAGGIAGVISRTATAPLDRLKVYLIANTGNVKDSLSAAKKGDAVKAVRQAGRPLIDATKELWKAGGVRSLFAGNGLNVVKVMPESAIKFGSYEGAKRALASFEGHGDPQNINGVSKFIAGGLGGMVSQLCVYPLDTLKFRMQCNVEAHGLRGNALIISTAKQMIREGGMMSAYRGLTMGLIGMFPYSAVDLGTFEFLKSSIMSYNAKNMNLPLDHPDVYPGSFATGTIGAFSGAFGASIVYPVNLLRTRLQAQGTVLHPQTYTGVVDCARKTVGKEGVQGLFKGITPNLLKVVPAVSITYMVYENAKKVMHLR
ncbi:hypothetical protein VC83_04415 [Pseudogymnoascus destructans]|uniref:Mitochondrial thiamine pyrophosphate carrier 1 n=2 Tax=Pseudogymnoascus destructans TaxID=655981 RepID=L8FZA0_PSED2|nr:uncharacterized protein VC83_04415 [Pseudogymnoascus destructans]ELR05808.1 hypothetical protein GMDG_01885 [Pseudogymnoascus destructans 20631-21]OAF59257.2 hypothetical protein VC83_04415 [Pseudogymnoascus destructans]